MKEACTFHTEDTTLNVLFAASGKHLMALGDVAFSTSWQVLTGGRYMFEVMITEQRNLADTRGGGGPSKNYLRVGFATEDSSLLLVGIENFCFDSFGKGFRQGQFVDSLSPKAYDEVGAVSRAGVPAGSERSAGAHRTSKMTR